DELLRARRRLDAPTALAPVLQAPMVQPHEASSDGHDLFGVFGLPIPRDEGATAGGADAVGDIEVVDHLAHRQLGLRPGAVALLLGLRCLRLPAVASLLALVAEEKTVAELHLEVEVFGRQPKLLGVAALE